MNNYIFAKFYTPSVDSKPNIDMNLHFIDSILPLIKIIDNDKVYYR